MAPPPGEKTPEWRRSLSFSSSTTRGTESWLRHISQSLAYRGEAEEAALALAAAECHGKLHPQIGSDKSWRELAQVMTDLRERSIPGKAIFHVD